MGVNATPMGQPQAAVAPVLNVVEPTKAAPAAAQVEPAKTPEAATEQPKVEPPKVEPVVDKSAAKFAALARQEKEIREREAKIKEREAKFSEYESKRGKVKEDPLTYLKEEYGLTLDDLVKLAANDNKPTPDMVAKKALEEVENWKKKDAEEKQKAKEEAERKAREEQERVYSERITSFKTEIGEFIKSKADDFEFTSASDDGVDLIYDVIEKAYIESEKNGEPKILSIEEAAKAVEDYFEKQAEKLLTLKKVQGKVAPKAPEANGSAAKPNPGAAPKEPEKKTSTLTNAMETSTPPPADTGKPLSIEESKRRAASFLKFTSG